MNFVIGWRSKFLWLIILLMFSLLVYKLSSLTTKQKDFLAHQGTIRSKRLNIDHASRGVIFDRNQNILAQSLPSAKAWVAAKNFNEYKKARKQIDDALGSSYAEVLQQYKKGKKFLLLKRSLSPESLLWASENYNNIINLEKFDKRYYPMQNSLAPVLGLVNSSGIGQEGIERAYDRLLQSQHGKFYVETNRKGAVVRVNNIIKNSKQSNGVTLTLDSEVQRIAYDVLKKGLEKVGAESGEVVIVKPKTGEIYGLANYPGFNPNNTTNINFENVKNRAITDLFEPGSTMKTFTIAAALESKKYKTTDEIDTGDGTLNLYGHKIEDEFHKHGLLTISEILKKSSNVGISKIALSLDSSLLPKLLENFGFSKYALFFPGESPGHINPRAWQHGLEQGTLAFGYGISVNAIQLAHAYAIIANNGTDPGIHIIADDKVISRKIIAENIASEIRSMLVHVTDYGGTAHAAKIAGTEVAGKTGTARIASKSGYKKSYVSSFVGMFPAKKPDWVILVVVKRPNLRYYFGGQSAAPIFAEIGSELLRLGVVRKRAKLPDY